MSLIESTLVTEKQIITPLGIVLNGVAPKTQQEYIQPSNSPKSIKKSLDQLFPEQQYDDKDIQKAREILSSLPNEFTTSELRDIISEIKFLVSSWLDDFERETFGGLTLSELLHEKEGL